MAGPNADPFHPGEELIQQELGRVVADFTIQQVPQGGAPESVKQAWVGVVLPIRQALLEQNSGEQVYGDVLSGKLKHNPDTVPVYGFDATAALRAVGREAAADFWAEQGFEFATLNFRGNEGTLTARSE